MNAHESILDLKDRMGRSIIGQEQVVERLLLTLLCNGNPAERGEARAMRATTIAPNGTETAILIHKPQNTRSAQQ